MWALRTVQSRTVRVDPGPGPGPGPEDSDAGGDGPVRGMVPVLDLLNHGPGRATEVEVRPPCFVTRRCSLGPGNGR